MRALAPYFKNLKRALKIGAGSLLVSSLLVASSGCGLKLGEKAPENQKLQVGGDDRFSCMTKLGVTVGRYFRADIADQEINTFIDCMAQSLTSFEAYTAGKNQTGYHPDEVRNFLHLHFVKNRKISDALLYAVMDLKVTLFGGKRDYLTRNELLEAIRTIEKLRPIVLRIRPLMPVLNPNIGDKDWPRLQKTYPLEKVKAELTWASGALADIFDGSAGRYSMTQLLELLKEFRQFVDWEENFQQSQSADRWINLVRVLKGLFVNPPEEFIEPQDWRPLLDVSANWYVQFLRFRYQVTKLPILHGTGLGEINALFDESFDLIDQAILRHPNRVIEIEEIDRLFDTLGQLDLLPFNIQSKSFKSIVRALLQRVFGDPQIHPDERKLLGLTRYALAQARGEFSRWSDIQMFLDQQLSRRRTADASLLQTMGPLFTASQRSFSEDVFRITERIRPLFRTDEHNVYLVEKSRMEQYGVIHGFHNLSFMNLIRGAVGLGIRGFASHFNRSWSMDSGFTEDETQKVYEAIQDVGIDLKFMDPRSVDAGRRSFLEANLFTYTGDGINEIQAGNPRGHLMVFEEAMELVAFLYSGGVLSDKIYRDLALGQPEKGIMPLCKVGSVGIHDFVRVERSCAKKYYMDLLRLYGSNMPELMKYIDLQNENRKLEMTQWLLDAAYSPVNSQADYIEKSEISVMTQIVHYSEAVMTRYNANGDDVLDTNEIWEGFPTFRGFIKKVLVTRCEESHDNMVRDIFKYIISNGKFPTDDVFTRVGVVWSWVWWNPSLDRGRVQEVFASIISAVMKGEANKKPANGKCLRGS